MRILMVILCLLVSVSTVYAQAHPCDITPPAQPIQSGAPYKVQFCAKLSDNIEAAVIWVDSQAIDLLPVTAMSAPSSTGWVLYETGAFLQVQRGVHTLIAAVYNRNTSTGQLQAGLQSPPFQFDAVDPTPPPPVDTRPTAPVIKGVLR